MNILHEILDDTFIFSFGWTLINSLWQGAIVAFITSIILVFLKKQSSSIRYNISIISLTAIFMLSIWTFISFYKHFNLLFTLDKDLLSIKSGDMLSGKYSIFWFEIMPEIVKAQLEYFSSHLPLIIALWFAAVLFLSVKYMGSYAYSQRLRHSHVIPVRAYWIDKVSEYSKKLNLRKSIQLLESKIVKIPIVIGCFRPAVIVPIGFFTGIPHEQIEAIIIHELAHIKRNDYVVKLYQTIVEILFFFNPFVWWISSNINKEREHCCDDLAVSITKDNISFVKALAGLCEFEAGNKSAAIAFSKSKNQIIKRMERIMKKNENKNNLSHFTIALIILMSSLVALGTTAIRTVEAESNIKTELDTNKIKQAKIAEKEREADKALQEIQESIVKLKTAYEKEEDPAVKVRYKQKMAELEKKAKTIEKTEIGERKIEKIDEIKRIENAKKIEELEQKLSVTKDKKSRMHLEQKLQQLKMEAEKNPPPPPPPPKSLK